jgi:hypothetical protein
LCTYIRATIYFEGKKEFVAKIYPEIEEASIPAKGASEQEPRMEFPPKRRV